MSTTKVSSGVSAPSSHRVKSAAAQATESDATQRRRLARAAKAAAHFDISKSTLWHWAATKPDFPQPLRCGRKLTLFDLDSIEAYLVAISQRQKEAA